MSIIFTSKNNSSLLAYKLNAGKIIKLGSGIYSDDLESPVEKQIKDNLNQILAFLNMEGAYVWSSGLNKDGNIFLEGKIERNINLNGVKITVLKNNDFNQIHRLPIENSKILMPSFYRAIIENLSDSKMAKKFANPELAKKQLLKKFSNSIKKQSTWVGG